MVWKLEFCERNGHCIQTRPVIVEGGGVESRAERICVIIHKSDPSWPLTRNFNIWQLGPSLEKHEYNMNYWTRIKWILSMVNDSASGETNVGWKLWRWIREEGPWLPTTKLFRHLWGMRHALLVSWTDSCFRSFEESLGTGWQRHICDERHGALWAAPRWAISGARGCHQSD